MIVGDIEERVDGIELKIEGSIRAENTDSGLSHVTFTYESWNVIHAEMERLFSGKKIVGWYHSHPGFGVFLSPHDKFICRNFFNLPWQVALVVDPIKNTRGWFVWHGEQLVEQNIEDGSVFVEEKTTLSRGNAISNTIDLDVRDFQEAETVDTVRLDENTTVNAKSRMRPMSALVLVLIALALVLLSISHTTRVSALAEQVRDLQVSNESLLVFFQTLQDRIASVPDSESISGIETRLVVAENTLATLPAVLRSTTTTETIPPGTPTTLGVQLPAMLYTVKASDTLWEISKRFYGDPGFVPMIATVNGLTDPDLISVGSKLVLLRIDTVEK